MASLVLAIASFMVCPVVPAVIALILGRQAQEIIRASRGSVEGEGLAKAGVIISIVHLVLAALALVVVLVAGISGGFSENY